MVIALSANAITSLIGLVQIETTLSRRRFLDVITDTVDDISGSIGIVDDTGERFPNFAQIRRVSVQKAHGRARVVARGGDRLGDLVSQGGGQFPHHGQTVHVRQI